MSGKKPDDRIKASKTVEVIENIQNTNPQTKDYLSLREKVYNMTTKLSDAVQYGDNMNIKDLCLAIKTLTQVMDFDSRDKTALLRLVSEMSPEKIEVLKKQLALDNTFDKMKKASKDAEDIFS